MITGACVNKPFKRSRSWRVWRLKLGWNAITFPEGEWMLYCIGRLFIAWRFQ